MSPYFLLCVGFGVLMNLCYWRFLALFRWRYLWATLVFGAAMVGFAFMDKP